MRHSKHYWRAAFIIIGIFFVFLIFRGILYPKTFGKYGHYRGDAVRDAMNKQLAYAAPGSCANCHSEIDKIHRLDVHRTVQCQNCHEPESVHIQNGEMIAAMPTDRSPGLCLVCHRKLPSRPKDFPQISAKEHLQKSEQDLEEGACLVCHSAHKPSMK